MHSDETFLSDFKEIPAGAAEPSAEPNKCLVDLIRDLRLPGGQYIGVQEAKAVAVALEPHLTVFRDMVIAGEQAGWDIDNGELLNAGRAAVFALLGPQN